MSDVFNWKLLQPFQKGSEWLISAQMYANICAVTTLDFYTNFTQVDLASFNWLILLFFK
jgi:hypothetical protein